ncbi:unnamed protein product, partial [Sphacelaria rigidula]
AVLLQQASHERSNTAATVAAGAPGPRDYRIVAAGPQTSAEFVARGIVAGTCLEIHPPASYLKSGVTAAANNENARFCPSGSGGAGVGCGVDDRKKERVAYSISDVEVERGAIGTRSGEYSGGGSPGGIGRFESLTTVAAMTNDTSRMRDEGTLEPSATLDYGSDAAGADVVDSGAKTALSSSGVTTAPRAVDKDGPRTRTTSTTGVDGGSKT